MKQLKGTEVGMKFAKQRLLRAGIILVCSGAQTANCTLSLLCDMGRRALAISLQSHGSTPGCASDARLSRPVSQRSTAPR